MTSRSFRSLGLSDTAFLQGVGIPVCPITTADANTQCWYRADEFLTDGANPIIGDKMDTTVNKASVVTPNFNIQMQDAGLWYRVIPRANNNCNFLGGSSTLLSGAWNNFNGVGYGSDTRLNFLAAGNYNRQSVVLTEAGKTYTYKVKIQRISGNTALRLEHNGAASGNFTAITIDGVLTQYSTTFTGHPTGGTVQVGVSDPGAGGFGGIEIQEAHCYRSDHNSTYVITTGASNYYGTRNGLPVFGGAGLGGSKNYWLVPAGSAGRANPTPYTLYMSVYGRFWIPNGLIAAANNPTLTGAVVRNTGTANYFIEQFASGAPNLWRTGGALSPLTWGILTLVWNGAASEIRINKNPATVVSQPVATANADKWQLGGDSYAGLFQHVEFFEVIARYTADNTALQDDFIDYMAYQVGLTV
jgi:hypothetical protein